MRLISSFSSLIFHFLDGLMTITCFTVVKQVIFDFRFLALLAVGGSLAGSFLCFLNVLSSALLKTSSLQKFLDTTYYNKLF